MNAKKSYLLVDTSVAPDVFLKVVEAKNKLASGKCRTINEAIEAVKISRSAFYKYKNYVFAYSETSREKIITLFFTLEDVAGILSDILRVLASFGANVLTINQNIPVNGIANITVSFRTDLEGTDDIVNGLYGIEGINKIDVLAME